MNKAQKAMMSEIRRDSKLRISKMKSAIQDQKTLECKQLAEIANDERNNVSEMLKVLNTAKEPMTAHEIAYNLRSKGYDFSTMMVAGNLIAINDGVSRFKPTDVKYGQWLIGIDIPNRKTISIRKNKRTATFAELDENGNIIPNTIHQRTVKAPNTYEIR